MAPLLKWPPIRTFREKFETILMGCLLLVSGAVIPSSREPDLRHLPRPEIRMPPRPWVALTFDDGPHDTGTVRLLSLLKQERVPATFFVVGKMVERYPHLLRAIHADGHEIANHTYNHHRLSTLENVEILKELETTRTRVRTLTGQQALLYRPPGGDFTRRTLQTASQAGYRMVLWSVQTKDISGAPANVIRHKIVEESRDGGIVLMHSGMPHTLEALPEAIHALRERGFHFVTVSQLLGAPRSPSEPVSSDTATTELAWMVPSFPSPAPLN